MASRSPRTIGAKARAAGSALRRAASEALSTVVVADFTGSLREATSPPSSTYRISPRPKMSAAVVTGSPRSCSGLA